MLAPAVFSKKAYTSASSRDAAGHLETTRQSLLKAVADAENRIALYRGIKDPHAVSAIAESAERRRGPIDILINSAGAARRTSPEELKASPWDTPGQMHRKTATWDQGPIVAMARST